MYEGTWESVGTHTVPDWYDDAKLGVFLHWGLYSVPGWAPRVPDIQQLLVKDGPKRMLRENPYAEWYLNSLQIKGSPTQLHHARIYGDDYPYDNFVKTFNDASAGANLDAMADALPRQPARATSSSRPSTTTASRCGPRASLTRPRAGITRRVTSSATWPKRCGPGACAWGCTTRAATTGPTTTPCCARPPTPCSPCPTAVPTCSYVTAHVRELIDRYQPSVLWNDIGWPPDGRLAELFAYYYNAVEDGVINDRWRESGSAQQGERRRGACRGRTGPGAVAASSPSSVST